MMDILGVSSNRTWKSLIWDQDPNLARIYHITKMNQCNEENFLRVRHYDWVIVAKSQDRRASIATISNNT